jgi:hypothetical protein
MPLERRGGRIEACRRQPIVGVEEYNERRPAIRKTLVTCGHGASGRLGNQPYAPENPRDFTRVVRRSVVYDNDLNQAGQASLPDTRDGIREVPAMIVARDNDGDQWKDVHARSRAVANAGMPAFSESVDLSAGIGRTTSGGVNIR